MDRILRTGLWVFGSPYKCANRDPLAQTKTLLNSWEGHHVRSFLILSPSEVKGGNALVDDHDFCDVLHQREQIKSYHQPRPDVET